MPKKRRGHGEGTIFYRKDKKLWVAQMTVGHDPDTVKIKRVTFYGKTRKEAREKLNKALVDLTEGTFVEPSQITVKQWITTWLQEYMKPHLRPTTWGNYETLVRCHIIPAIGEIPLRKLRPEHLQKLYNDLLKNGRKDGKEGGLSPRMVRYTHSIIHHALEQAVKNGLVVRNVSKATERPKQPKKEMATLTAEQVDALLEEAKNDRLYPALVLEFHTGLRLGELLALRWEDVDLKAGLVSVKRSLARVKNEEPGDKKTKIIFQEPKTGKGIRTIPIPADVVSVLRTHKIRQTEERLKLGPSYNTEGLVFTSATGGPIWPESFRRYWKSLLKRANLPDIRFHDARHTFATLMLELGEHPKTVQEILGHSRISQTLDTYSHVRPEMMRGAVERLADLLRYKR